MNHKLIGLALCTLSLAGCAAFRAQNCGENAGYKKGFNDAKAGRMMTMDNYPLICDKDSAALAQKGYSDGYKAAGEKGGAQLNLGFKDGKLALTGAYECKADFGGETFSESASTEDKARADALAKCRAKYPACPETAVACAKN